MRSPKHSTLRLSRRAHSRPPGPPFRQDSTSGLQCFRHRPTRSFSVTLQVCNSFAKGASLLCLRSALVSFSVAGWMTVIGWQALVASTGFIAGTMIQALAVLTIPTYQPANWQGTLIIWVVLLWGVLINTTARKLLPRLEGPILLVHILGFFGVMIPLVVFSSHRSSSDVWRAFENGGAWSTQGLSTMIGLLMSIFLFTGVDGAIHVGGPSICCRRTSLKRGRCPKRSKTRPSLSHARSCAAWLSTEHWG